MPTARSVLAAFGYDKVKHIIDAKRPLAVEITKQDAGVGTKKKHTHCVVAEACKRKMHLDGAIVSTQRAYMIKGDTATRYTVPESIRREITSFDRGAGFAPGTYNFAPVIKRKGKRRSPTGKTRTRKLGKHHITGVREALAA